MVDLLDKKSLQMQMLQLILDEGEPQTWSDFRHKVVKEKYALNAVSKNLARLEKLGYITRVKRGKTNQGVMPQGRSRKEDLFYISKRFQETIDRLYLDAMRMGPGVVR